jgi:hypothetical protein
MFMLIVSFATRRTSPFSDVNIGKVMKQPENIQEPQDDGDDYDAVQDGFDRSLHGDEAIHQPQENTHHDENFQELN